MPNAVNDNDVPDVTEADQAAQPVGQCPICSKPTVTRWRPFCSRRCADIDLHRWLSGSYAIPSPELSDGEEDD